MAKKIEKPSLIYALISFIIPVFIILYGTTVIKIGAILPLIVATIVTCLFAACNGFSWNELESAIFDSISRVMVAILILIVVGMLIGILMLCGTIPTLIYWGLKLLSPSTFLATAFLLCAVGSVATGTSFGTMGTIGVALLGVGTALGYPAPMVVGAIVSGAYFGDKMSPVSDTTNVAASVCEVSLFGHIASMLWTTVPAAVISFILYMFLSSQHIADAGAGNIPLILQTLGANFNLSLWTLLPPVIMIVLAYCRVPAVPLLALCVAIGAVIAWGLQDKSLVQITQSMMGGYKANTNVKLVDSLLSRGGINSITGTLILLIGGVAFGGVLEKMGTLSVLMESTFKWAKNTGRLVLAVLVSSYITLLGTGAQMVAVIIPGRAFNKVFKEKKVSLRVLSRCCEDAGTIGCALVPWGPHSAYIFAVLGLMPYDFAPYAFLNWITPIISVLIAYLGIGIWYTKEENGVVTEVKKL